MQLLQKKGLRPAFQKERKESGGFMIGEREGAGLVCHWVGGGTRRKGGTTRRIHIRNRQHEHKRNLELRIETKRTTYILGAEVYE